MRVYAQTHGQPQPEASPHHNRPRQHTFGAQAAPMSASTPVSLQAIRTVDAASGSYEPAAANVSGQVTNMPAPQLQRACACGGGCPRCRNAQVAHLQPNCVRANDAGEIATPTVVHEVLRSSGQPLDTATRGRMESRFGHDFSQVRVHTGPRTDDATAAIGARAFTMNRDIVFGTGEYTPQTLSGRQLLAHELTHVVQQRAGGQLKAGVGAAGDAYERHADEVARTVSEGRSAASLLNAYRTASASGSAARFAIQRQSAAAAAPTTTATQPTADELTTRIARCVGIWETNRGKNTPAPKESALDPVAGVHASMATIEQATTPYAITALKAHKELRAKASPALTLKELNAADARATAVNTLLKSVADASANATTPDDFIKDNATSISATGLSNDDVKTMFKAVTLKSTIDTAHAEVAAKKETLKEAVDAIPATDRLGLGEGSLKAYINKPGNWGENRAGWQRKAVAAMPDNVGTRIEAVAISDSGTALAIPVIKGRVDTELAKTPVPSTEDIVKTVAQQNNPHEKDYGLHVWENYQRLYP